MAGLSGVVCKALAPFYISTLLVWGSVLTIVLATGKALMVPFLGRVVYMKFCGFLAEGITAMMLWLFQSIGCVKVTVYSEVAEQELMRDHTSLSLWNHVTDLDWVCMPWFMFRIGKLPALRTLVKDSLKYVPVFGWMWKLGDFIFLKRSMEKDQARLEHGMNKIKRCRDGDRFGVIHYWASLFPEGTRWSPAKLKASQDWQESQGMTPMRHVQYPRTKGVISLWRGLGCQLDAFYTFALGYPNSRAPTYAQLFNHEPFEVAMYIRKWDLQRLKDAGEDDAAVKTYIVETWRTMDDDLEYFHNHGKFDAPVQPYVSSPIKSVDYYFPPVMVFCQSAILYALAKFSTTFLPLQVYLGSHLVLSLLSIFFVGKKKEATKVKTA